MVIDRSRRARGIPAARLAIPLLDGAARSGPGSRFRYVWVVQAGLPPPLVNRGVDHQGFLAGVADLLDVEAAMVGEYDGAQHRELAHHTADNAREEGLEALNLTVVRATAMDLWPGRRRLVQRLRDGHRRGSTRDRTRDAFGLLLR